MSVINTRLSINTSIPRNQYSSGNVQELFSSEELAVFSDFPVNFEAARGRGC